MSLCSALVSYDERIEAAFFESTRVLIVRLLSTGTGKKISLVEINEKINELLKLAAQIQAAKQQGTELGLTEEEQAFYDALTRPEAIKDFYDNDELVALTKELTDTLRKNKSIDWDKRDDARARMRMLVKKLLKKYKYPPEGMEDAVATVLNQCELWTDENVGADYGNISNVADKLRSTSTDYAYAAMPGDHSNSHIMR